MKPDVPAVLADHATRLADRIVPLLSGFDANSVAMMSAMLTMVAEAWDGAAARRVEENVAIRSILREARAAVTDAALVQRLDTLAAGTDRDLNLTALDADNDALRLALTDLHAHVEMLDTPLARAIVEKIWEELRRSVERRRIGSTNF